MIDELSPADLKSSIGVELGDELGLLMKVGNKDGCIEKDGETEIDGLVVAPRVGVVDGILLFSKVGDVVGIELFTLLGINDGA